MPAETPVTSSLVFACADFQDLLAIADHGLGGHVPLHASLEDARRECPDCILVLDAADVNNPVSIRNISPYLDPEEVPAAGGFVLRAHDGRIEVLLIFRRGVWDLPKGKQDAGESIEECARREVREELGIDAVTITGRVGRTIHGYPHGDKYAVKTTHWFTMSTDAATFRPQAKEKIERVEWVPLSEAKRRLGFDTLRSHLRAVENELKAAVASHQR